MKTRRFQCIMTLCLSILGTACDKEDLIQSNGEQAHVLSLDNAKVYEIVPGTIPDFSPEDLRVENDMLRIKNGEILDKLIHGLNNQSDEALNYWETKLGFFSMRRWYDRKQEDPQVDDAEMDLSRIPDPSFEAILNLKGFFQVADTVYQIAEDKVVIFNEEGEMIREQFFKNASTESGWSFKISVCERFLENGSRKIVGRKWVQNYINYTTVGAASTHYKKNIFGKFKKAAAPILHLYIDQWHQVCYDSEHTLTEVCHTDDYSYKVNSKKITRHFWQFFGTYDYVTVSKFGRVHHWFNAYWEEDCHTESW